MENILPPKKILMECKMDAKYGSFTYEGCQEYKRSEYGDDE
jgi:hypothetical protein